MRVIAGRTALVVAGLALGVTSVACGSATSARPSPRSNPAPVVTGPVLPAQPSAAPSADVARWGEVADSTVVPVQPSCTFTCVALTFNVQVLPAEVPGTVSLAVAISLPAAQGGVFTFCGAAGRPVCGGGGILYTLSLINVPRTSTITSYRYEELNRSGGGRIFAQGPVEPISSTAIAAELSTI
jgi:hypothetical protein